MSQALTIHHELGDVVLNPADNINKARLKKMIRSTLDQYLADERVPANVLHEQIREHHGDHYGTPGYTLRLYRQRADLTQVELASKAGIHQHHLSEMENNKRVLGKALAKKLAAILDCDYQKLL